MRMISLNISNPILIKTSTKRFLSDDFKFEPEDCDFIEHRYCTEDDVNIPEDHRGCVPRCFTADNDVEAKLAGWNFAEVHKQLSLAG